MAKLRTIIIPNFPKSFIVVNDSNGGGRHNKEQLLVPNTRDVAIPRANKLANLQLLPYGAKQQRCLLPLTFSLLPAASSEKRP